jgi:hypothetical protein
MFCRKNMGSKESWARVIGASGVFSALTGLVGFCPACAMAGRKSLEGPR